MRRTHATTVALVALATILGTGPAAAAPGAATGPGSSAGPYLVRTAPGVVTTSLLTVGDRAANGYRMVGFPDGLGAFDNGDGTFTLLVNHELGGTGGIVRAHGFRGAFVSRWTIDTDTLRVVTGEDLVKQVLRPDAAAGWAPYQQAMARLCSADLPPVGTFEDVATGDGTRHRILLNGDEINPGRAYGHVVDGPDAGTSYVLTGLGRQQWENLVTMPGGGPDTVVLQTNDEAGGQVFVYVGRKRSTGNDVERAGLTGGRLYGVAIAGSVDPVSGNTTVAPGGARFELVEIPGADTLLPGALDLRADALGVSHLDRPEDAVWDGSGRGLWFATTGAFDRASNLWHLTFDDPADVLAGGTAEIAVTSPPYDAADPQGPRMMDNLTVNDRGQVLIQEDPGDRAYSAGVYQYDPSTGGLRRIAQHDPALFTEGGAGFLTQAEESSGIIPASFLGRGKYLLTSMAHYATGDPETVQGGQLLELHVPPGQPVG
ncbi:alkaline phosphatase PhoX [Nocardioides guangzhouensis]|nr:alkaline phosphatase PhoX [Nocardioides guangzhouensis]